MSTPLAVTNHDITSQLAAGPQSVEELGRSLDRPQPDRRSPPYAARGPRRLHRSPLLGETRYMLTTKATAARTGPIQTSIADVRYAPPTDTALTGYSRAMREFHSICMLARRRFSCVNRAS